MGREWSVEVEGLDAVLARFDALTEGQLEEAAQRGMDKWALIVADGAKERAPYRSGKGRRAIYTRPLGDDLGAEVVVPPIDGVPYMFYQHEGTGVYGPRGAPIVPVNAKFLRFTVRTIRVSASGRARSGSSVVYARSVRGVPPNPFLLDSFFATVDEGKRAVADELNAVIHG